jgi:HK97 family phage portal protein
MTLRATSLAQIPWYIKQNDSILENHALALTLQEFGQENIAATEIDMLLMGAAFWLKDADRLVRLNPNTMEVLTSTKGVTGFKQTVLTQGRQEVHNYSVDEVVYFREYHPTDDLGIGVAAMDVARPAILAEYEAQRYVRSFFENDAIPGLLLTTPQEVQQSELDKLRQWWAEKFQGSRNHHKVAFVDRDLTAQVLTTDLSSMALAEVRDLAHKDICTAFQVPDILVGNMTDSTYANAAEARQFLMEEVVIPRADYYADVINKQLVTPYDMNVTFEFAFDELEILQEDANAKATRLALMLDKDVIDIVYFRDEMGIPQDAGPSPEEVKAEKDKQMEQFQGGDAGKWQRKAIKALKAGKSANVPFETDELSPALSGAIRMRLEQATTPEDVRQIFHGA